MSLIYNATFDSQTRTLSLLDKAGNVISSCEVPSKGNVDDVTKPLTFKATQDGSTVRLVKNGSPTGAFQTSRDGGNTWTDYTIGSKITLNTDDEVSFRAKSDRTSSQSENYFSFTIGGKIEAWHNVMSMIRTNDFATYESVEKYSFSYLFKGCTSLTKAPVLPATTLAGSCYSYMFSGCTSLTEAPVLPATTLASNCYSYMFSGCTSLTEAPDLPATTLAGGCYQYMFSGCWKLTKAPVLPATTLAAYCYYHMFDGCTSLTEAHELPATTLADNCYDNMFVGCTSLTKAPELPATTLATYCYANMFNGCTSLTEAPVLPATTLANLCCLQMFSGCTSLTKAPELPATTLANNCYNGMFSGCKSLTEAPVLPATTLAGSCYSYMFKGCTSLTEAPVLPATTLDSSCYSYMFYGCTSLTKAPELLATGLADSCYEYMFKGCSSLNRVRCKISSSYSSSKISQYTENWLDGVSSTGTFYTNADANWPSGVSGIPTGWIRVNEGDPAVDDITKPLTFMATQDGSTVSLKQNGSPTGDFQTSNDGGNTWEDYTIDTVITLNTGDEVSFRAKSDRTSGQELNIYFYFKMTGKIEARHNVMSLYRTNDFAMYNTVVEYAFNRLFDGCTSLTKAPILPATTLTLGCYRDMFKGCTSLVKAPELPAITLAGDCYFSMFSGCTSLTKAHDLPATTLASSCYKDMFGNCTSLTKAPELPATTLAQSCYNGMFYGCTSLTKAPVLQATALDTYCYFSMFNGCTSLNEVHCQMPSSYSASAISSYTESWLSNVSSTGTFYTNADANWPSGASGIPAGWTRVAVDDITKPLTFKATQDGSTVLLKNNGYPSGSFQTSTDGGNTWANYTIGTAVALNAGDEVSFRAKADRTEGQVYNKNYFYFMMTGKIEAWHNVMSMIRTNDFATYESVFGSGLAHLFDGCTSLTKAPILPATTLGTYCYDSMFVGCTSLVEAPALPAISLSVSCYGSMFINCTSLTKSPELLATGLAGSCYESMFYGCSSLNEVRCKIPSSYSGRSTNYWLNGVSATGTFYTNADAKWSSGSSGIPKGWTRVNA